MSADKWKWLISPETSGSVFTQPSRKFTTSYVSQRKKTWSKISDLLRITITKVIRLFKQLKKVFTCLSKLTWYLLKIKLRRPSFFLIALNYSISNDCRILSEWCIWCTKSAKSYRLRMVMKKMLLNSHSKSSKTSIIWTQCSSKESATTCTQMWLSSSWETLR